MKKTDIFKILVLLIILSGCAAPQITLFPDAKAPLREFTLEGQAKEKILLIPISGVISSKADNSGLRSKPGMVQEIVAHLNRAELDQDIKTILIKVDSPGGSTTASDILYHEILKFKKRTGKKVVVIMMNIAASGGYYISLPADMIIAHPTTVTGSVGVIFMRPGFSGLMNKIGVKMEVNKSGENKDMMSPFREPSADERKIVQKLTDDLAKRFTTLVSDHRDIQPDAMKKIKTARVFIAKEAKELGLIDKIGYIGDAVEEARNIAGIAKDSRLVVYRRSEFNDDNWYNSATSKTEAKGDNIIGLGFSNALPELNPGFYYIWSPAIF